MDLVFPIDSEPASLDPQIARDNPSNTVISNCLEGLVRFGANGEIVPGAALSWNVSSTGLIYTFHLRQNAKWHLINSFSAILGDDFKDSFNTAVTAGDFVFALTRAVNPQTGSPYAASLFIIKNAEKINMGSVPPEQLGVRAVDNFTLEITLEHGSADFFNLLASPVCMPCNEVFFTATKGKYGLDDEYLLCNGPFYLSYWAHNFTLTLSKNKDYQGNSDVSPNSVSLTINPDTSQSTQKLLQDVYSAAPLTAQTADSIGPDSGLTLTACLNITWSICFNCSDSALSNSDIRLSFCRAIDKNSLGPNLAKTKKTDYFIPPCCIIGQTSFGELSQNTQPAGFDLTAAKKAWNTGIENLGLKQISLTLICPPEYELDMRGLLQIWQKALGIKLSIAIEVLELTELQKRVANGNYQIAFAPVQTNKSMVTDFLQSFGSGSAGNIFKYSSGDYDSILKQLKSAGNLTETVEGCESAQNNLLQNGMVYPVFSQASYFVLAKGVSGIYQTPAGESVYFIQGKKIG